MSTTSLKIPDDLKERAAAAAKRQGVSTHAFLVEAIKVATAADEARARLVADAKAARKEMLKTGEGFDADEVHAYLRARATGQSARPPKARSWRA